VKSPAPNILDLNHFPIKSLSNLTILKWSKPVQVCGVCEEGEEEGEEASWRTHDLEATALFGLSGALQVS